MPRRRSSFTAARGTAQRRKTAWLASADENTFTAVGGGIIDFQSSLNAAALALRPFTIVRVRGMLSMISDQVVASEEPFGAYGMAVVTDQAVTAGVASLPSPITEEGSDVWFMYHFGAAPINSAGVLTSTATTYFESKAMRKVGIGEDIVQLFENANSTHGVRYVAKWRMLVKLH